MRLLLVSMIVAFASSQAFAGSDDDALAALALASAARHRPATVPDAPVVPDKTAPVVEPDVPPVVMAPVVSQPVYAQPACVGGNCSQQQQSYTPWRPFQRFR